MNSLAARPVKSLNKSRNHVNWTKAKAEYVNSSCTCAEIASKYGVKLGTVTARAGREDWTQDRAKRNSILLENAARKSILDTAQELVRYNERDLEIAKDLRAAVVRKLNDAQKQVAGNPDQPLPLLPKDIRALAGALESVQRVARLALGASTENTLTGEATVSDEIDLDILTHEEFTALEQLLIKAAGARRTTSETPGSSSVQ